MRSLLLLLPLLLLAALPARGEEVLAGLSQNRVSLTANFDGSEILVFGAVRREAPVPPDAQPLQVIITIQGPSTPVTVWRKARRAGIWINVESVRVSMAPSFYAVASTGPLPEVLNATDDLRHRISIPSAIRAIGIPESITDGPRFTEALMRIRTEAQLYQQLADTVELAEETLFHTAFALPSNLTEGTYATRVFLTRGGEVVDVFHTSIDVQKVGLERWLHVLAQDEPLLYGLLALLIAVSLGWGASAAFRYIRP